MFTIVESNSTNVLSNVISDYVAGEQFAQNKWRDLVMYAYEGNYTADSWKVECEVAEEDQAKRREQAGEKIARTEAGKVIASKTFPKTYRTDKYIVGKALAEGVDLVDVDGKPKPKTALQDEYKAKVAEHKEEKPAREKLATVINAYNALFDECSLEDQEFFANQMRAFYGTRGV
jgi:hypothetical protein